jgi:hypothetical protein
MINDKCRIDSRIKIPQRWANMIRIFRDYELDLSGAVTNRALHIMRCRPAPIAILCTSACQQIMPRQRSKSIVIDFEGSTQLKSTGIIEREVGWLRSLEGHLNALACRLCSQQHQHACALSQPRGLAETYIGQDMLQ